MQETITVVNRLDSGEKRKSPASMRLRMAAGFAAFAGCMAAGAAEFPAAGGDLADNGEDGWNGAKPGSSETATIASSGTYTASSDVEFGRMSVTAQNTVFDLSDSGATVCLSSDSENDTVFTAPVSEGASVEFRGGTWFMKNRAPFKLERASSGLEVVFTDGCVVTNTSKFSPGFLHENALVVIEDRSRLHAESFYVHEYGYTNTRVKVRSGGSIHVTGTSYLEANAKSGGYGGHVLDISDSGSCFSSENDLNLGVYSSGNMFLVHDGASVSARMIKLGGNYASSTNHRMEVFNNATVDVEQVKFNQPYNSLAVSNAVLKTDELQFVKPSNSVTVVEGSLETGGLDFTHGHNSLYLSDSSFSVQGDVCLGNADGVSGNAITVSGPNSIFSFTGTFLAGSNHGVFTLENGASFNPGSLLLMNASTGSVFRITGGAEFDNRTETENDDTYIYVGYRASSCGNTLEISDGATVATEKLFIRGISNRVTVSNATLTAYADAGYGIWLGHSNSSTTSNCTLVVRGDTPSVDVKELKFGNYSVLRYEIPPSGYAKGHVPVKAGKLSTAANGRIEIDCTDWRMNPESEDRLVVFRRLGEDLTSDNKTWLEERLQSVLPPSVGFSIDGSDVALFKRRGTVVTVK